MQHAYFFLKISLIIAFFIQLSDKDLGTLHVDAWYHWMNYRKIRGRDCKLKSVFRKLMRFFNPSLDTDKGNFVFRNFLLVSR
jgi:hypothetical protein